MFRTLLDRKPRPHEAPLARGGLPFLGHAREFGRDLDGLIRANQRSHGDLFTLRVAGRRMTFLLDPLDFPHLLKAHEDLVFADVVDDIGRRAFGFLPLAADVNERLHAQYTTFLKKSSELSRSTLRIDARLDAVLAREAGPEWRSLPLQTLVARWIFAVGQDTLFGEGGDDDLFACFQRFDRYFPLLVAGVPAALLPGVYSAKARLLASLRPQRPDASGLLRARSEYLAQHYAPREHDLLDLALLWAIQANTAPAAFWTLAFLLHQRDARAAITREIEGEGLSDLRRLPHLHSAISEALRLSSGSIILRRARREGQLQLHSGDSLHFRKGDHVCLYPRHTHLDPEVYEDPHTFRHDRFLTRHFTRRGERLPIPLMPFGGGASMCPGRFLANNEILLFVAKVLTRLDIELLAPTLPGFDQSRAGLGVLPPTHDLPCRFRLRPSQTSA